MSLKSWLSIPRTSHFSLANIPFGIISHASSPNPHPAIAIGDHALDLEVFTAGNGFSGLSVIQPHQAVFSEPTLNAFAALGRPLHSAVRKYIQSIFLLDGPFEHILASNADLQKKCLIPLSDVEMHLPMRIGDYTDFYAGLHHAFRVGELFRGAANALQPNYHHLPVGYHGRASSIVVSGTPIRRPNGQILLDPGAEKKVPVLSPSRKLDIELELGAFVCKHNDLGTPISINEAGEHLFGLVLLNDWSARDIQAWEYVPLGPFNGKNFGTTISPWIVLMDALEPYRAKGISRETELLQYLQGREDEVFDIKLEVDIKPHNGESTTVGHTNGRNLLFSFEQMLTHHTVGGCSFNVGDFLGSGTISGTVARERGSLLESNENGKVSISLNGGQKRTFLEDGDQVTLRGWCGEEGMLVGFGECIGRIEPAASIQ